MCNRYKIKEGTHALIQAMVDEVKPEVLMATRFMQLSKKLTAPKWPL